jgi:hypothetical protein
MKFSEMLVEYLELARADEQPDSEWTSISECAERRHRRSERIAELLSGMDELVAHASGVALRTGGQRNA